MGSFPTELIARSPRGAELFDETGLIGGEPERLPLTQLLKEGKQTSKENKTKLFYVGLDFNITDPDLVEFIEACLVIDPQKRPFARDLLKLKYVQEAEE
jgi:hypothetical protein